MSNLLTDPVIHTRMTGHEAAKVSLPALLAAMMRDEVATLPALRPHQRHAWHAFLAQLGAIALHAADQSTLPEDEDGWRTPLRALTPSFPDDEPWRLMVEDISKPAFLQPPVPEGSMVGWKTIATPDQLDILITAKNFDLKQAVADDAGADDWLFALVSLQTMEGFLGAGNYGIARMNGGFSSRPFLGFMPANGGPGAHLRRDIVAMLAARAAIAETFGYRRTNGLALLWLEPWEGTRSLPLERLDPYFVEICRRVRLTASGGGRISTQATGTKAARIAAKDLNGVTGDFWTPVNRKDEKALSLAASGFDARTLTRLLLTEEFDRPPALRLSEAEQAAEHDWMVVARGMARGQGKTEGWHEAIVPFRRRAALALGNPAGREGLAEIAALQLEEIGIIAGALRLGIAVVASGGRSDGPSRDDYARAAAFTARLQAEADLAFFDALQDRFEAQGDDDAVARTRRAFIEPLIRGAEMLLGEASETVPCTSMNRPRARVRAERAFWGSLRHPKNNVLLSHPDVIAMMFAREEDDERADATT